MPCSCYGKGGMLDLDDYTVQGGLVAVTLFQCPWMTCSCCILTYLACRTYRWTREDMVSVFSPLADKERWLSCRVDSFEMRLCFLGTENLIVGVKAVWLDVWLTEASLWIEWSLHSGPSYAGSCSNGSVRHKNFRYPISWLVQPGAGEDERPVVCSEPADWEYLPESSWQEIKSKCEEIGMDIWERGVWWLEKTCTACLLVFVSLLGEK